METLFALFVAAIAGGALALLIGWLLWGRDRGDLHRAAGLARADADDRMGKWHDAMQQAAAFRAEAETLRPRADAAPALAGQVAALQATQAERDAAHARQLAQLNEGFQRLAGEALGAAQKQFAAQADETLKLHRAEASKGLDDSKLALAGLLAPVSETLARYEADLKRIETERTGSYESLREMLGSLAGEQTRGRDAVLRLETALRSSGKVAGRWGEEQCRNVLEAAGLVEGVDFDTQVHAAGDDGALRPDFVIRLPGDRRLVVDVKCSIDAYLAAAGTDDAVVRQGHLLAHARAVRSHATGLAGKDYARQVGSAVDFVVMFVHGENYLGAAMEADRGLMTDFFNKRVVLAGPVNLIAIARTLAAMRDQARLAKEAADIAKLGRDLYDALRLMGGNVLAVQQSLGKTVENFNKLVGQMDSRVMLRARRFEAMGATTGLNTLPELAGVNLLPQAPTAPEIAAVIDPPEPAVVIDPPEPAVGPVPG
jgi:DNA recombination protein RmuC